MPRRSLIGKSLRGAIDSARTSIKEVSSSRLFSARLERELGSDLTLLLSVVPMVMMRIRDHGAFVCEILHLSQLV